MELMSSSSSADDVLLFCCCMAIKAEMAVVPRSLSSVRWALAHSRAGSGINFENDTREINTNAVHDRDRELLPESDDNTG